MTCNGGHGHGSGLYDRKVTMMNACVSMTAKDRAASHAIFFTSIRDSSLLIFWKALATSQIFFGAIAVSDTPGPCTCP